MSSSISLATWCSVTVRLSFDVAVCVPLAERPPPVGPPLVPLPACIQSPPPYHIP